MRGAMAGFPLSARDPVGRQVIAYDRLGFGASAPTPVRFYPTYSSGGSDRVWHVHEIGL